MKRKKIIRISTAPISLLFLLKGQLKMLSNDYDVIAVSSPGPEMELVGQQENVRTVCIPMKRHISLLNDVVSLIRLIIFFLREKPDMVHSLTPKAGLLSMMAARIARVPVRIHTFTGLIFPTASGFMQRLLIASDRLICSCATYINPEGEGVKNDLVRYKITSKPLHIIARGNINGIDLDYYARTSEVMEKANRIGRLENFTFCFVGRMVRDKGINELVHAFIRLYKQNKQIRLLLVGAFEKEGEPLLPETQQAILHHPAILFTNWQNDVRPFLAASDILVFPSYREGFPNVVLQAGALELPAIVTDINGCNEIVIPEKNGFLIAPRDKEAVYNAMSYCLSHPDTVREMASRARSLIAARYEQRAVWEALAKEYRTLLKA